MSDNTVRRHTQQVDVLGPRSLAISRQFWEGFTPGALTRQDDDTLHTSFRVDEDWSRAEVEVTQHGDRAKLVLGGGGDLDAAAQQVCRFLSLDIDARDWPATGKRDLVLAAAQADLPGLRPCGFRSAYEAAVWPGSGPA